MLCTFLVVISSYSTGYDTDNTSSWTTVYHHPEKIIVISSNVTPDPDLSDQFIHPEAEQVSQQTNQPDQKTSQMYNTNVCHLPKM